MLTIWAETSTDGWEIAENWYSSNPYQDPFKFMWEHSLHSWVKTDGTRNALILSGIEEMLVRWRSIPGVSQVALQQSPCADFNS